MQKLVRHLGVLGLLGAAALGGCGITVSVGAPGIPSHHTAHPGSTAHAVPPSTPPGSSGQPTSPLATSSSPPPIGYLGVQVTAPPSDWTAQGCEVVHAMPGSPAANAGMVGSEDRTDPVGDVIDAIALGGSTVQIPNCAALSTALGTTHPGEQATIYFEHRVVTFLIGHWHPEQVLIYLGTPPCPPAIVGQITSAFTGNRIPLSVEVVGPRATVPIAMILDTGADQTTLPENILLQAGFTPFESSVLSGVVPGAETTAYGFRIAADDLEVLDTTNGQYVPLGYGNLVVWGVPNAGSGLDNLIGPDMLRLGAQLTVSGSTWTLTPPCP